MLGNGGEEKGCLVHVDKKIGMGDGSFGTGVESLLFCLGTPFSVWGKEIRMTGTWPFARCKGPPFFLYIKTF